MSTEPSRRLTAPPALGGAPAFGRVLTLDERRNLVLGAAARMFESHGFHGTSMQAIADEVGVTKAALYHYVDSKEQMLYEIHDAFISTLLAEASAFVETNDDPSQQLRAFIASIFHAVADYGPHVRAFFRDFGSLGPEWQDRIRAKRHEYERYVESCLEEGVRRGIFDLPAPAHLATLFLFGACNWSYQWMHTEGPQTPDELVDMWYAMITKAFAPVSGPPA
jgi:AcrR family transcriptional regulator